MFQDTNIQRESHNDLLVTEEVLVESLGLLLLGGGLLGTSGLALLGSTLLLCKELSTTKNDGIRVELNHGTQVLEGVLLLLGTALGSRLLSTDNTLDFIGVDDTSNVSVGDHGAGDGVSLLGSRSLGKGSEDTVKRLKSTLGPDDETSNMTTGGKIKEVEAVDGGKLYTGEVAEGLLDGSLLLVHNEGSTAHGESAVTHLTLSSADLLGVLGVIDIVGSTKSLEKLVGILGLGNVLDVAGDDEGELRDVVNLVSTSHHKGGESGGSKGRSNGMTTLSSVDLSVPSSPGLGGGEHATLSAHVTEGGLSGAGCSSSRNTRNTSNGTTSTPRLSRVLVTSHLLNSVSLSAVLGHVLVGDADYINTNRGSKDSSKGDLGSLTGGRGDGINTNEGAGRHFNL